jgi:hypothetical protein
VTALDAPARDFLADVAADLAWPHVTLGRYVIGGQQGWETALYGCPPLLPRQRTLVLARLGRQLLTVGGGRQRLRAWCDAQRAQPSPLESAEARRSRLLDTVAYYGDPEMLPILVDVLAHVPRPVSDTLSREVAFFGTGWSTLGATMGSAFVGPDGARRTSTVLLNGAHRDGSRLGRTIRHELGHCWTRSHAPDVPAITACGHEALFNLARAEGWLTAWLSQSERYADALAFAWAFHHPVASPRVRLRIPRRRRRESLNGDHA